MPSLALITPLPVNALPDILEVNVPNSIEKNLSFCYFVPFLIVSLIPFTSNPDSSSDLTILIIFSISSFEIVTVVPKGMSEGHPDP